jgi:hypothetical protein
MRQKTLEKKIKAGKTQPKFFQLETTGTKVKFIDAPNKSYIPYLVFEDEYGRYLGYLDPACTRKDLRQLQRWVNKCLKGYEP